MSIALRCQRCGKAYKVSEANAGNPVQCSRCRFIMVVPRPPGSAAKAAGKVSAPIQEALDAAAAMEETASQHQQPVVFHPPWYKPWVKPRLGAVEVGDPLNQPEVRRRADLRLVAIGVLPVLAAALLLYYLVPWGSLFSPSISARAEPQGPVAVAPPPERPSPAVADPPPAPAQTAPAATRAATSPTTAPAPHWTPQPAQLAQFGPYVAYQSVAIRGPRMGMHLLLAAKGGLTWLGPEKGGITPYLLLNVSPPDEVAALGRDTATPEQGWIGNILMTRQTTPLAGSAEAGSSRPLTQVLTGQLGAARVVIRIQCAQDDPETLATLQSAAFTLRPSTPADPALASGVLPPAYDPAASPSAWEPDPAAAALLMPRRNALEYTISPPLGLKNDAPGAWMGQGEKLKLDGVTTPLPLLRMDVQPLAGAEYHTAREWADAQWTLAGRDAQWGIINGQVFACVKWTETSVPGKPALCERYVGIAGERFVSITIANWASESDAMKALEQAVRTIKIKPQRKE